MTLPEHDSRQVPEPIGGRGLVRIEWPQRPKHVIAVARVFIDKVAVDVQWRLTILAPADPGLNRPVNFRGTTVVVVEPVVENDVTRNNGARRVGSVVGRRARAPLPFEDRVWRYGLIAPKVVGRSPCRCVDPACWRGSDEMPKRVIGLDGVAIWGLGQLEILLAVGLGLGFRVRE